MSATDGKPSCFAALAALKSVESLAKRVGVLLCSNAEITASRLDAVQKVPFSSLFYCSNPLAAGLTRRRTQIFFVFLSLLHIPESSIPQETIMRSAILNFTILEYRDGHKNEAHAKHAIPQIGVSRLGEDVEASSTSVDQKSSIIITFSGVVEWDAWYLITSTQDPSNDPVKFSLQSSLDGADWSYVGSSRTIQVGRTVLYMHETFQTSTQRGLRHNFPTLTTSFLGYTMCIWLGMTCCALVPLFAFLRRERLATDINTVQNVLTSAVSFAAAYNSYPLTSSGNYTSYCFLGVGVMMGTVAALCFTRQWLASFIVLGLCHGAFSLYLQQFSHNDRNFLWTSGAAALCITVALGTKAYRRHVTASAAREIEPDRRAYAALWRLLLEDPRAAAAQAELESILQGLKRGGDKPTVRRHGGGKGAPSDDGWEGGPVRRPAQQIVRGRAPGPAAGAGRWRLRCESFTVHLDLDLVYEQAASAYDLLRHKALQLAAAAGGLLPARPAADPGLGFSRLPSAGGCHGYVAATGATDAGEAQWAGLKRRDRALEKAMRSYGDDATLLCDVCRQARVPCFLHVPCR